MATITFDTHKFIKTLQEAGFQEPQAEALSKAFQDMLQDQQPVSREYLDFRLKADIAELKTELIKWMTGALIAQAALITTLVKLL
jgi:hypothetical protein